MSKKLTIGVVGLIIVAAILISAIIFLINLIFSYSCSQLAKKIGPDIITDTYVWHGDCLLKVRQQIADDKGASKMVETWVSANKVLGK